jgi:hypothetical protein
VTVPEVCAELDRLSARREEAVTLPSCPPDLVAVSDRVKEMRAALAARVRECQAQMLDVVKWSRLSVDEEYVRMGRRKIPDAQVELLYFTSWALLKTLDKS